MPTPIWPWQDDPARAIYHYREILRIGPGSPVIHNELGSMLAATGELGAAIDHFRQAVALDPEFALAHADLGSALQLEGNLTEAIEHYRAALRIASDAPDLRDRLDAALAELAARER